VKPFICHSTKIRKKRVPLLIHIFVLFQCFEMLNPTALGSRDKELPAATGKVLFIPDSNV